MVSEDQFNALMTQDIFANVPEAQGLGDSTRGGVYSDHASWAVWKKDTRQGAQTAANDKSVLASYDLLKDTIHTNAILVGLNSGTHFTSDASISPWSTFHSGKRDWFTAQATSGTPLEGAYMTDLYKGLPTPNGAALRQLFKERGSEYEFQVKNAMKAVFEEEMKILGVGSDVPIICFGDDAHEDFNEIFQGSRKAVKALHYSAYQYSLEHYVASMRNVIEEISV